MKRCAVIVGARGELGTAVTSKLHAHGGWKGFAVDVSPAVREFHPLWRDEFRPMSMEELVIKDKSMGGKPWIDAVVHVAGGFERSEAVDDALVEKNMWLANSRTALVAAGLAQRSLRQFGCLCLTGSRVVMEGHPTRDAAAYGMAKAGIHHLALTMASTGIRVICALPGTLDFASNSTTAKYDPDIRSKVPIVDIASKICDKVGQIIYDDDDDFYDPFRYLSGEDVRARARYVEWIVF